jgi:competence protein ComEA
MIRLPFFSRSQLGIVLILGAALLGLYAWRAHVVFPPAPPPPGTLNLTFVEVKGKALRPGVYSFPQPPSLREVWARAGAEGTPPDPDKIIASGSRVEVKPDGGCAVSAMSGAQLLTLGLLIDLNRAAAGDLAAIPGMGPALAQRIVDYRQAHGPFQQVEDLRFVTGVGPVNLQKLRPYLGLGGPEPMPPPGWKAPATTGPPLTGYHLESQEGRLPGGKSGIGPKTPAGVIDPNRASQTDLETLPGIGPVLARRIIDYRRVHGPYRTVADLRKVSGIGRKKLEKMRPYLTIAAEPGTADGRR